MHDYVVARLSALTDVVASEIETWVRIGLVDVDDQTPTPRAVEQVQLLKMLVARGVRVGDLAEAVRSNPALVERVVAHPALGSISLRTVDELAADWDLDGAFVQGLWSASGVPQLGGADAVDQGDAARMLDASVKTGLSEQVVVEVVSLIAEEVASLGDAMTGLVAYFAERLRAEGAEGVDLDALITTAIDQVVPLIEVIVASAIRAGALRAAREDLLEQVAEDLGLLP